MKIQTTSSLLRWKFGLSLGSPRTATNLVGSKYLRLRPLEPKAILWNSRWVAVDPSKAWTFGVGTWTVGLKRVGPCFWVTQNSCPCCFFVPIDMFVVYQPKIRFSKFEPKKTVHISSSQGIYPNFPGKTMRCGMKGYLFPVVVAELRIKLQLGQPVQTALVQKRVNHALNLI